MTPLVLGRTRAEGEVDPEYLSIHKARERLDWRPRVERAVGLYETYLWYSRFLAEGGIDSRGALAAQGPRWPDHGSARYE